MRTVMDWKRSPSTQPGVLSGVCEPQSYFKKEVCQVGIVALWRQTEAPPESDLGLGRVERQALSVALNGSDK